MIWRHTLTWIDVGSRERVTILPSIAGSTATVDLMRLLSNAALTTASDGPTTAIGDTPSLGAQYPDLSDHWIITAADLVGDQTQLYVPAPLLSTADVDGRNWDSGASPWIGFGTFMAAMNGPYTGAPLTVVSNATIARDCPHITQQWFNFSSSITWGRRTLQWDGVHGRPVLTHIIGDVSSLGPSFDDVQAALQALSSGMVTHWWEAPMAIYSDPPTVDMYNSVNDACEVYFQDVAGNLTEVIIPAPNRVIFLPDGKTLDVAQVNVAGFIASAIAQLAVPVSGLPVVACVGGQLSKRSVY